MSKLGNNFHFDLPLIGQEKKKNTIQINNKKDNIWEIKPMIKD